VGGHVGHPRVAAQRVQALVTEQVVWPDGAACAWAVAATTAVETPTTARTPAIAAEIFGFIGDNTSQGRADQHVGVRDL